jgi:hypothetical protein
MNRHRKRYTRRDSERERNLRHERAVEAELNRPLTQAELEDLEEEIREAMGEEEEIDKDVIKARNQAPKRPRLSLVWLNPRVPDRPVRWIKVVK